MLSIDGLGKVDFVLLLDVDGLGKVGFVYCLAGAGGVGRSGDFCIGCG